MLHVNVLQVHVMHVQHHCMKAIIQCLACIQLTYNIRMFMMTLCMPNALCVHTSAHDPQAYANACSDMPICPQKHKQQQREQSCLSCSIYACNCCKLCCAQSIQDVLACLAKCVT